MAWTLPSALAMLPLERLPLAPAAAGFAFLDGIRVLDFTSSVAGPYCTMMLADMGAEVIKVERPGGGDDSRAWGPPFLDGESLWFLSVNRGKRSVALDYATTAGREVLHDLVRSADVIVVNLVARAQAKLGLDAATLARIRPDLVHASITGFGLDGARADRPCYDLIAEGYSGVMDLTGELHDDPQKVGTPAADILSGMDAAYAIVCALFERMRTGRGRAIDVSMVESMTRFMAPRLVPYLGSGEVPRRSGAKDSVIAIYQVFHAADLPLTLGLGNDAIWKRFWQAVERPGYGAQERFAANAGRRAARAEIVAEIQSILRERRRDEWLDRFAAANVPAGPIYRADEVTQDEALLGRGLFYAMADGARRIPQVGPGIHVDGAAGYHRLPPPRLGADAEHVLREVLGYDAARIRALRDAGVIQEAA
jgi:crotonobetainyl-CoA:carnitine CoA-transferase CaiB-like acyl-CoA transferase